MAVLRKQFQRLAGAFSRLSVRQKLFASTLLLLLMGAALAVMLLVSLRTVNQRLSEVSSNIVHPLWVAGQSRDWLSDAFVARTDIAQALWAAYGDYAQGSPAETRFLKRIDAAVQALEGGLNKYLLDRKPEGKEKEIFSQAEQLWKDGKKRLAALQEALTNGAIARPDAKKEINSVLNQLLAVKDKLVEIVVILKEDAAAGQSRADSLVSEMAAAEKRDLMVIVGVASGAGLLAFLSLVLIWRLTRSLGEVFDSVSNAGQRLRTMAAAVSASAQGLAQTSGESAAALEETSASLAAIQDQARSGCELGGQAQSCANEAARLVAQGLNEVGRMGVAVGEIDSATQETSKVLKTIEGIAFQTNLLALNAAVEAARAGDAG